MERLHPDDRAETVAALNEAKDSRKPYNHKFRTVQPDGSTHRLFAQRYFFFDQQGTPVRMIGVMRAPPRQSSRS